MEHTHSQGNKIQRALRQSGQQTQRVRASATLILAGTLAFGTSCAEDGEEQLDDRDLAMEMERKLGTVEAPAVPLAAAGESQLRWGMKVVISGTPTGHYTPNCGWFGCRVAFMDGNLQLRFDHGGQAPQSFHLRPEARTSPNSACVQWHEKIVIAYTPESGDTFNCGWYGCRVAQLDGTESGIEFDHGGVSPDVFYVRPPAGESRSGCVPTGAEVVLAYTDAGGDTFNCGWYGCRVGHFDGNNLVIDHGGQDPAGVYMWDAAVVGP